MKITKTITQPLTETSKLHEGSFFVVHVAPNIGSIVGGLIGGPIGAVAGHYAQKLVNDCMDKKGSPVLSLTDKQYPLVHNRQTLRSGSNFVTQEFKPTVQYVINGIDNTFNANNGINKAVIDKANKTYQYIAALRAYGLFLKEHGDGSGDMVMAQHKADVLLDSFLSVEKMILKHFEDNNHNYRLVSENFKASSISKVSFMKMNWQNKNVWVKTPKYVSKSQPPKQTETPVIVGNTDPQNPKPPTLGNGNTNEITVETSDKMNPILKGVLFLGVGYAGVVAYNAFSDDYKKE